MIRRLCVLLLCSALPAHVHAQLKLAWKLEMDDVFFVEETTVVMQRLRARAENFEQGLRHTKISRMSVKGKNADGSLVLEQQIVKVQLDMPDEKSQPGAAALRKLAGSQLLFTLDGRLRVTKVDGHDKLIEQFAKPAAAAPLRQALTVEALRAPIDLLFAFVPEKEVAEGASWVSTTAYPFGPLGRFDSNNTYTLQHVKPDAPALIAVQSQWQFIAAPREQLQQMRIANVNIDKRKADGSILFDATKGRVLRSELEYAIAGVLSLDNGVNMELQQQGKTTLRVFDKMPEEKAPSK